MKSNFLSLLLVLCASQSLAAKPTIKTVDLSDKSYLTNLPNGERFYLVFKASVLLDFDLYNTSKYEKIIGSLKTQIEPPIRTTELIKLPELGLKIGEKISYFDSVVGELRAFTVPKKVTLQLVEDPYDSGNHYSHYSLMLAEFSPQYDQTQMDYGRFDSVAIKGYSRNLKPGKISELSWKSVQKKGEELNALVADFISKSISGAKSEDLDLYELKIGSRSFFKIQNRKDNSNAFYTKLNGEHFLHLNEPDSTVGRILGFGDTIEGSEFTAIVDIRNNYYLFVFYKDRTEAFYLWNLQGSKG